ncbi:translationally-controlled tumor protein homolog [Tubulanus polymorphus]|uniref:translationally-controlled tumor protein homolog n=1 Tax=Tubulanus polymorphus TaxID=672921 RepID=UPI003DA59A5C
MKVFQDHFTGEDVFSDAYKYTLVDDLYYTVDGKWVSSKTAVSESLIGGNRSAENDEQEKADVEWEVDFIGSSTLREITTVASVTDFKQQWSTFSKKLLARIKETDAHRVEHFKNGLNDLTKNLIADFDASKFYATKDDEFDLEGGIYVLRFLDLVNKEQPYLTVLKAAGSFVTF